MIAGEQHLKDAGYKSHNMNFEEDEEEESNLVDDELKITPWRVTKNVIGAFQVIFIFIFILLFYYLLFSTFQKKKKREKLYYK